MPLFKNILLPVDFSINTEMEIKKAIELIQPGNAVIHLLHVAHPFSILNFLNRLTGKNNYQIDEVEKKLQQWKYSIEETIEGVMVEIHLIQSGSIQKNIIKIANQLQQPLIIIGDYNGPKLFPFFKKMYPSNIARVTKCAVLTIRQGSIHNKIKSIIVPVRDFIPRRKIEMVAMLAKKYKAKVHLVTLANNTNGNLETANQAFLQTYRMLRMNPDLIVDYRILQGNNLAKAAVLFAKNINADMILVNPQETKTASFYAKDIDDLLSKYSRLQILSVEPYANIMASDIA